MEIYYCTKNGPLPINEDSLLVNNILINNTSVNLKKHSKINKTINKFIICDGIGGMESGNEASRIVLQVFSKPIRKIDKSIVKILIEKSQELLEYYSVVNKVKLGTTIAGVIFNKKNCFSFNVGDTRIYKFNRKNIIQLSKDHTLAEFLYEKGELTEYYKDKHSSRHILTSALCSNYKFNLNNIHFNEFKLEKGDIIFICSDGVWNHFSSQELFKILEKTDNLKYSLNYLINNLKNISDDNYSFIAIKN